MSWIIHYEFDTPKQYLRLLRALTQVKAGNIPENLLNEIC